MDLNENFFFTFRSILKGEVYFCKAHLNSSNNVSATLGDMGREF